MDELTSLITILWLPLLEALYLISLITEKNVFVYRTKNLETYRKVEGDFFPGFVCPRIKTGSLVSSDIIS